MLSITITFALVAVALAFANATDSDLATTLVGAVATTEVTTAGHVTTVGHAVGHATVQVTGQQTTGHTTGQQAVDTAQLVVCAHVVAGHAVAVVVVAAHCADTFVAANNESAINAATRAITFFIVYLLFFLWRSA